MALETWHYVMKTDSQRLRKELTAGWFTACSEHVPSTPREVAKQERESRKERNSAFKLAFVLFTFV